MKGRKPKLDPRAAGHSACRRISKRYREHLETIALLFLRTGRCKEETVRAVQIALPHLKSFKAERLTDWAHNPEWLSALRSAEFQNVAERELPPDVRGAKLLNWAKDALAHIESQYEIAKAHGDDKERGSLEKRLLAIHEAVRSEERHQDSLKTQAMLRDFRAFVANVVTLVLTCTSVHECELKLRDVLRDPAKLMGVTVGE